METGTARWGTWEELLLGGAVLRHGAAAWDVVASELRARSPSPFTPQECEAKYKDLQQLYSGCSAWFEELRKRRVAELRKELEKSEDSIGSLQLKLESLNAKRGSSSSFEYGAATPMESSPSPTGNADDGIGSSSKEASRDGSSAGSYTGETGKDWSQQSLAPASVSSQEHDTGPVKPEKEIDGTRELDIRQGICRKKRGQRKRKGCSIAKDESMGESNRDPKGCNLVSAKAQDDSGDRDPSLARIMNSIMELKDASIFQRRLESQKRARYKKMIRRHVDFQNISLRIKNSSISSSMELLRDLLLLANNALVFYPKNSEEHDSATGIRDLVNKELREHFDAKPVKVLSLHPCSGSKAGLDVGPTGCSGRKRGRGRGTTGGGRGGSRKQYESPSKGRKRARC